MHTLQGCPPSQSTPYTEMVQTALPGQEESLFRPDLQLKPLSRLLGAALACFGANQPAPALPHIQLPCAGDPSVCTHFFSGLFNRAGVGEAPALPAGEQGDELDSDLNERVTEHKVGAVS
jgi:hypothetical protein